MWSNVLREIRQFPRSKYTTCCLSTLPQYETGAQYGAGFNRYIVIIKPPYLYDNTFRLKETGLLLYTFYGGKNSVIGHLSYYFNCSFQKTGISS